MIRGSAISKTAVVAAVVTIAALAAVGCGAGDEDEIRAVYGDLQEAFAERDYGGLCAATTATAQRHVGYLGHQPPSNCERDMRKLVAMARADPIDTTPPRIVQLRVDGDRATAIIAIGSSRARVPFAKDDGDWKVDALYGGIPAGEQRDKFRTTL